MTKPALLQLLPGIQYPVILAPMFMVTDVAMVTAAFRAGATAAIPAHNFRNEKDFNAAMKKIREQTGNLFGINLIVNRSNIHLGWQLPAVCQSGASFVITSLGNPRKVIEACHRVGMKVFCDVTDVAYAQKVQSLGADAVIAVNNQAGGHAGNLRAEEFIPALKKILSVPVISAGGVATAQQYREIMQLGADGVSVGTVFIATHEAPVSMKYKNAVLSYGADDVVLTTRLSGTPCTIIQTDYVKRVGTRPSILTAWLSRNKRIKKWLRTLAFRKGMKQLDKSARGFTYQTVWCAGPSIEYIHALRSVKEVVDELTRRDV